VVARGYPLGEILRQLGGGPPDPTVNVEQGNLQFQTLANPTFHRWQTVQEAILNLNRFVFRIAIYDEDDSAASGDPVGLLASPDAWRIFLRYHWEFVDERSAAPRNYHNAHISKKGKGGATESSNSFSTIIAELTEEVKVAYPDLVLPPDWQKDRVRWTKARRLCSTKLDRFIRRWMHMRAAIELCQDYRSHQESYRTHKDNKNYVDEGYPALIFGSPYYQNRLNDKYRGALQKHYSKLACEAEEMEGEPPLVHDVDDLTLDYRERWFALMQEGYLISKPFRRKVKMFGVNLLWRHWNYDIKQDIPKDPRTLEPYVMRTHSLMTSVLTPANQDPKKRPDIPL
jgi:hypothetical protein